MSDNFGLKIGLEGEKEFKKSLAEINNSFKVLGSEMKLVDSEFDRNDKVERENKIDVREGKGMPLYPKLDNLFD